MDSIPPELVVRVCTFLCTVSLCQLCGASKLLRTVLKDDPIAWEPALQSTWWYSFDTLKRHDNFTFWCSQFSIRTNTPPDNYKVHKIVTHFHDQDVHTYLEFSEFSMQLIGRGLVWWCSTDLLLDIDVEKNQIMIQYICFASPTGLLHCMRKRTMINRKTAEYRASGSGVGPMISIWGFFSTFFFQVNSEPSYRVLCECIEDLDVNIDSSDEYYAIGQLDGQGWGNNRKWLVKELGRHFSEH